jgi:prolyl oligopeptidase
MSLRTSLIAALLCSAIPAAAAPVDGAPIAKVVPFTETVQGIPVDDPYRWMESGGPDYDAWLKAQATAADSWLAALPMRDKMLEGISARSGSVAGVYSVVRRGDWVFMDRRDVGAQTYKLYVRQGLNGAERVLFDPATLDTAGLNGHAINYWEASPDGRHVYLGVSAGGSEEATLKVFDTASGKQVGGDVPQALWNGGRAEWGAPAPQWLPDGSGFFYLRLADGAKAGTPNYFLNPRLFLRQLGPNAGPDRLIVAKGVPGAPEMIDAEAPIAILQPGSAHVLLFLSDGVGRSMRLYRAPIADVLAGRQRWTPVGSREDRVEGLAAVGDDLYLLRRDRSRGRVVMLRGGSSDIAKATEVVPEGTSVIDSIVPTREGLYLVCHGGKGSQLQLLRRNGTVEQVAMPFVGASYIYDAVATSDGLMISLENYSTPRTRLLVRDGRATAVGIDPKPPFPTDDYVSELVTVTARDGTRVPMDLVRRKDSPKDGKRPVLMDAYGAYGASAEPYFNPRLYAFLDAGGIYASPRVRGGGEYGADWHLAGKDGTKPNTWRDAIDSAEWLNKSGWTSGKRITLWGTSAGGIMVGRAVTERPDLWAGAIASVGAMNAMRFEFTPNGKTNIAEFGTVATPEGANALHAMDAYAHVRAGTAYPPMLLTAGANDPRVIAWQPAKFAARMQAASPNPVIFDVDYDQGHGIGSMRSQLDQKAAEVSAFALWAADRAK